jgi:serine/threonine protein kinase
VLHVATYPSYATFAQELCHPPRCTRHECGFQPVNYMSDILDLKLGNLFLDANMDIKVGDFGLATRLDHPDERKKYALCFLFLVFEISLFNLFFLLRTLCGTPNYIAPEILDNNNGHSFEVDVWSIGVIMYTLLIGRPPFETSSVKSTYKRIRANSYEFPRHVVISSAAKQLISSILQSSAELRPSLQTIAAHPFFSQSPFPKSLPLSALTHVPNLTTQEMQSVPQAIPAGRAPFSDRTNAEEASDNRSDRGSIKALKPPLGPLRNPPAVSAPNTARERMPEAMNIRPPTTGASTARFRSSINSKENTNEINMAQPPIATEVPKRTSPRINSKQSQRWPTTSAPELEVISDIASVRPMTGKLPASTAKLNTSEDQLELIANDVKRLKLSEPDNGGHLDAEDQAEFQKVHNDIERSFCFNGKTTDVKRARELVSAHPATRRDSITADIGVSVNKWVDYSNKYGVGYLLTNNNVGVYFNDSSQIIMAANANNFEYVERKGMAGAGVRVSYTMTNYPSTLQKKVTLLKHFHAYLKNKSRETPNANSRGSISESSNMVYVKKWLRTTHAILFRLSNQTVQVIFFDQTEILLSSNTRTVIYTDKQQQMSTYPLDTVNEAPRPDLARRMRYTQDILFHLLSRRNSQ